MLILLAAALGSASGELPLIPDAPQTAPCVGMDFEPRNPTDVYDAGPALVPGWYRIWCGQRTGEVIGQPDQWMAYGPVELLGGTFYVFDVVARELSVQTPQMINPMLSDPLPGESVIWYRLSTEVAYVVCFDGPYQTSEEAL
ncbi:MAG: hypothetical protein GKC10_07640 [Methanosarcinales archaeon]|nr:hypothetical protein [Methanosarcinales archaeon]